MSDPAPKGAQGRAETVTAAPPGAGPDRLAARFAALRRAGRGGLVTFTIAGDPDFETSLEILGRLPGAGADLVEIGLPFSDLMADGPAIQAASRRALDSGQTTAKSLELLARFRAGDATTPAVLMGYYNPIWRFGPARFAAEAARAGADGLIVVDLPPEEAAELAEPAAEQGLHLIRLVAPTTGRERLATVLAGASGFVYHVAVTGITGTAAASRDDLARAIAGLRKATDLPIATGFGLRDAGSVRAATAPPAREGAAGGVGTRTGAATEAGVGAGADAAVVGSALVARIAAGLDAAGRPMPGLADSVAEFVAELAAGCAPGHGPGPGPGPEAP